MGTSTIASGDSYISDTNGTVTSVSGTTNRITVTNGTTAPVIDIAATYVGQSSITTVGTIGTGTWNGTVIGAAYGGTGVANNAASTLTISGNFGTTLTVSGATALTLPTSGTVAVLGTAQTFTAAQRGAFVTLTDAATVAIDLSLANNYNLTLGGNRTLGVPTNPVAGQTGAISIRQDITGSRTLAYAWPYMFPGGSAPTLSTAALTFDQLYYLVNSYSTSTVTVTIATPAVMTWTAHGFASGQRIQLSTTGALPTGLAAATTYWVTVVDANTFKLSSSLANAQSATFINTSGSQSGVQTGTNFSITIANNLAIA